MKNNMNRVTRMEVSRARKWTVEAPVFLISFKWDNDKARNGEAKFTNYIWDVKYYNPYLQKNGAYELDLEEVKKRCLALGLKKGSALNIAKDEVITDWSDFVTDKEKAEWTKGKFKLQFNKGLINPKIMESMNCNEDDNKVEEAVTKRTVVKSENKNVEKVDTKVVKPQREEVIVSSADINKLKQEVERELRAKLLEEAKIQAQKELRAELEAEVRAEVLAEMKAELEKQMAEDIKAKLVAEMKESMKEMVRAELREEIKIELSSNSDDKVNEADVAPSIPSKTIVIKDESVVNVVQEEVIDYSNYEDDEYEEEYSDEYEDDEYVSDEVFVEEQVAVKAEEEKIVVKAKGFGFINVNTDSEDEEETTYEDDGDTFSDGFDWVD